MTFKERLKEMLACRALTTWARDIQLSGGTISRISGGQVPGQQILALIQRVENVSLAWLVDGQGSPFLVHHEPSDGAAAAGLRRLMAEPDWSATVLTDGQRAALLLTQPGQYDFKGKTIDYTILEVLTGSIGDITLGALNGIRDKQLKRVGSLSMQHLYSGEYGTWRLFGPDGKALDARPMEKIYAGDLYDYQQADRDDERQRGQEVLQSYNRLTPHNKESVRLIIDTLLDGQSYKD